MTNLTELVARNPEMAVTSAEIMRDQSVRQQAEITRLIGELKKRDDVIADLHRRNGILNEDRAAKEEAIEEIEVARLVAILRAVGEDNLVFTDDGGVARDAAFLITSGLRTTRLALEVHRFMRNKATTLRKRCPLCRVIECGGDHPEQGSADTLRAEGAMEL